MDAAPQVSREIASYAGGNAAHEDGLYAAAQTARDDGGLEGSLDEYLSVFGDALVPAAVTLFDDLHRDLRRAAAPLPERILTRLRPFFAGQKAGSVTLTPAALDRTAFVVDPERMRQLFELAPDAIAAITVADVIAFAPGQYQPDCIEGAALIGHELVHVAQHEALGRERFLERYFLTETLKRLLTGGLSGAEVDLAANRLEIDAYCHQERICRALAETGSLPACDGRDAPRCGTCPSPRPTPRSPSE